MKEEQEIKSLIRECVAFLMEEGYSEQRIADYLGCGVMESRSI
jgi:predicted transcriptional regulator